MRLDVYLQTYYPDISRAQLQQMIKNGKASVNGVVELKNSTKLGEDDSVVLDLKISGKQADETVEVPVLYEDADCVVIDKPVGLLTHSKGAFNPETTVASWLKDRQGFNFDTNSGDSIRQGIVHRLDRATSGVMICAKNQSAQKHLQKQFQDYKAKKTYIARVNGLVVPTEALVDLPIERNPKQPQRFRVGQNGKTSQTHYKVTDTVRIGESTDSILELKPKTGRTHQLRVHLLYIKRPILGDTFYGGSPAKRLFLHANQLEITTPTKTRKTFTSQVPDIFYQEETA
jgi:23S rRNA pseudouridine1911/1915/1917 synthase